MTASTLRVQRDWAPAVLIALAIAATVGCGGKPVAQASGRVAYADGSTPTGAVAIIRFEPTDDSDAAVRKAASSAIAEDGTFELKTRVPGDGVYKGQYHVTFSILKNPKTGESLIPQQYTSKRTTPFTIDVQSSKDDYLFELEKL